MEILQILILLVIPQTVEVRVTGSSVCVPNMKYKAETINFKEYVKGTLPNEWVRWWPEESLDAGAVAVKSYAMSVYLARGYLWDCNWDMVYDPEKRTPETDRAVDETWGYVLVKDGEPVRTYFDDYPNACISRGQLDNCMSQYSSKADAENGMAFDEILLKYYDGEIQYASWLERRMYYFR